MAGAICFSTIPLAGDYYQTPVDEEDKHKRDFRLTIELWEFNVMHFGFKVPATFCRLINMALGHMTPEQVSLYMDNVCVVSAIFEDKLNCLDNVFEALLHRFLRLRADRCRFALREIDFFSHMISENGLKQIPTNTKAIAALHIPRSPREVKRF